MSVEEPVGIAPTLEDDDGSSDDSDADPTDAS
jgi:hypothetical protein